MQDYYAILGIAESADAEAIKKAYREHARANHPDLNPNNKEAEEHFKRVSEAYAVLSDPKKRAEYDQMRRMGVGSRAGSGGFQNVSFDLGDLFGADGPEGLFEQVFGFGGFAGQTQGRRRQQPGASLETTVELSFRQAMLGGKLPLQVMAPIICSICHGHGQLAAGKEKKCQTCQGSGVIQSGRGAVQFTQTCPTCHGTGFAAGPACAACHGQGYTMQQQKIDVQVPGGIAAGSRLRLAGKGAPSLTGGAAGDLLLRVEIAPDPHLKREGDFIVLALPITTHEAAAGASISVPTLEGVSQLKIPAGAQSGQKLRMRQKGIRFSSTSRGDQLVELLIVQPKNLAGKHIEVLAEINKDFNPRGF